MQTKLLRIAYFFSDSIGIWVLVSSIIVLYSKSISGFSFMESVSVYQMLLTIVLSSIIFNTCINFSVSLAMYYHIKNRDKESEFVDILDEKRHPLTVIK